MDEASKILNYVHSLGLINNGQDSANDNNVYYAFKRRPICYCRLVITGDTHTHTIQIKHSTAESSLK